MFVGTFFIEGITGVEKVHVVPVGENGGRKELLFCSKSGLFESRFSVGGTPGILACPCFI
jgi:hypothetical protein